MPLKYDDIPGSWGTYSKHWPKLVFQSKAAADRALVACSLECVVPYASYVLCDLELRVETELMKQQLAIHLVESPFITAREVIAHLALA